MRKILFFIFLLFLFFNRDLYSQTISGDECVDNLNDPFGAIDYVYSVNSMAHVYKWKITGPAVFKNNNGKEFTTGYGMVDVNFTGSGSVYIVCIGYDQSGNAIWTSGSYKVDVKQKISEISGKGYITSAGTYTYSISPVTGATAYSWTLPAGFTGTSNTNSITVNVPETAQSGYITVNVNSVNLCSKSRTAYIKISECMGRVGQYNADKITGRVVSGDFDNDGKEDDIAAFYDYGSFTTTLHVWKGNSIDQFVYQGDNGWWTSGAYDASKIIDIVSGDFDRDGYKDDIAVFYDYGNNVIRIHVWRSTGTSFIASSTSGWYYTSQYDPSKIKGRVVSGDFDRDGYFDDIAAFYDYGNFTTTIHVWQSTGSSFNGPSTNGWYSNSGYDAKKITDRVVSGDFDRDGYFDDIAVFYDYGNSKTTIHVWQSTGSSFNGPSTNGWYSNSDYMASKITGRVISGDFDDDGFNDDIAAFYDYGNYNTALHVWNSTGNSFSDPSTSGKWNSSNYDCSKLTKRVVSGKFLGNTNINRKSDITAFYNYGNLSTSAHVWVLVPIFNNLFFYQGDRGWWSVCFPTGTNIAEDENIDMDLNVNHMEDNILGLEGLSNNELLIAPNPSNDGIFRIKAPINSISIQVCDVYGNILLDKNGLGQEFEIDLSTLTKGIYFLNVKNQMNNSLITNRKIVFN